MNSSLLTGDNKQTTYPCLKQWRRQRTGGVIETVVLFTSPNTGTCVYSFNDDNTIGDYLNDWLEDEFIPFDGEVKLSN
jgi:hypothetical protein